MCVESVNYSVLVNYDQVGLITPGKGLRQGDPLSPYLFLLCSEGLSSLLHNAQDDGRIHGINICREAPTINHLLFADDYFMFFRATREEVEYIVHIPNVYEIASGQPVNLQKSEVFFSANVPNPKHDDLSDVMGVHARLVGGKYLGLPSTVGRGKVATFKYIKDRVWRKLNSLSGKFLSSTGREVVIKAVLQAIPS